MKNPIETLIAGETGSFKLEARLREPENASEKPLQWNRKAADPLVIWIALPDNSGIAFIDKAHPDRPHHHILVKFALPAGSDSQMLTAVVKYRVNSRTIAGNHSFWLDIDGELIAANGNKVQDMGNTRLPFKVDTHLRTKLLMLTVIAAAIFLFIVEWVRVDVVAMAMMVLLPELGLLNSRIPLKAQQQRRCGNHRGDDHQLRFEPGRPGQSFHPAAAEICRQEFVSIDSDFFQFDRSHIERDAEYRCGRALLARHPNSHLLQA